MTSTPNQTHLGDILIVDDQPDNIRFLSSMLFEKGYNVRKSLSGKMAFMAIETLPPDLILLDITMPDMSGYEVCKELKQKPETKAIPIIFLSALDDAIDKVKAFEIGGNDYITKPFQFTEVLARIENQLQVCRLQKRLQNQNHQLKRTLTDLKRTQTQLIQQERLAGLGQLVAGLAHEINNPISFIYGNLRPATEYVEDLFHLLDLYHQEYPHPKPHIQEEIDNLDLDFLKGDLPNLLASMQNGAERIRNIIVGLRHFACIDEAEKKATNLHENLESTLLMLEQRLQETDHRPPISIKKDYGELPEVFCYSGQLNQVFFNLILNGIEAIEQKSDLSNPEITIKNELTDENLVKISITDNGVGIPNDIKPHIFDPFFTTKNIGQGTGLGLAISYQIITEKQNGSIEVQTVPQEGTTVSLTIPLSVENDG
ncbi:response regulator [Spirulina sp. CS-785/01]|uniref:hybrid sensor histidine kinase/response regulator n=1 Tax=Spirulina sp. CS-785/01 TaxID=3021716 RepID=UPI00232AC7AE|nr:response regulator [Spirulina sp. CS-785/01]MDB9315042.1 response regulator [Spirulina sp. CS-785/01]